MSIQVSSNDGKPHEIQLYSDISAGKNIFALLIGYNTDHSSEWISGSENSMAQWSSDFNGNYIILQTSRSVPAAFSELMDKAEDGTAYYAMAKVTISCLTYY